MSHTLPVLELSISHLLHTHFFLCFVYCVAISSCILTWQMLYTAKTLLHFSAYKTLDHVVIPHLFIPVFQILQGYLIKDTFDRFV